VKIRIMLVDDHTMVREALRMVLEQDSGMEVIAEVGDGETALRVANELLPDVVVMDVALPGQSGIETTRRLLARHPDMKVVALSTYLDRRIIQQMLDVGARGYITKSAAGAELKQGIRSAVQGRSYLCAEVGALLADSLRDRQPSRGSPTRTRCPRREVQVVTFLPKARARRKSQVNCIFPPSTVDVPPPTISCESSMCTTWLT